MNPPLSNSWEQWQKHVLAELERLNDCYEQLNEKTQCAVHGEKIKNLDGKIRLNTSIIVVVIIGGIVLGLWIKAVTG